MQFDRFVAGRPNYGELCSQLSETHVNYIGIYLGADGDPGLSIDIPYEIYREAWVFYEPDFPLLQAFEESYPLVKDLLANFPHQKCETEYERDFAKYDPNNYLELKHTLGSESFEVVDSMAEFYRPARIDALMTQN